MREKTLLRKTGLTKEELKEAINLVEEDVREGKIRRNETNAPNTESLRPSFLYSAIREGLHNYNKSRTDSRDPMNYLPVFSILGIHLTLFTIVDRLTSKENHVAYSIQRYSNTPASIGAF